MKAQLAASVAGTIRSSGSTLIAAAVAPRIGRKVRSPTQNRRRVRGIRQGGLRGDRAGGDAHVATVHRVGRGAHRGADRVRQALHRRASQQGRGSGSPCRATRVASGRRLAAEAKPLPVADEPTAYGRETAPHLRRGQLRVARAWAIKEMARSLWGSMRLPRFRGQFSARAKVYSIGGCSSLPQARVPSNWSTRERWSIAPDGRRDRGRRSSGRTTPTATAVAAPGRARPAPCQRSRRGPAAGS